MMVSNRTKQGPPLVRFRLDRPELVWFNVLQNDQFDTTNALTWIHKPPKANRPDRYEGLKPSPNKLRNILSKAIQSGLVPVPDQTRPRGWSGLVWSVLNTETNRNQSHWKLAERTKVTRSHSVQGAGAQNFRDHGVVKFRRRNGAARG
jgi:hypothetical protein